MEQLALNVRLKDTRGLGADVDASSVTVAVVRLSLLSEVTCTSVVVPDESAVVS